MPLSTAEFGEADKLTVGVIRQDRGCDALTGYPKRKGWQSAPRTVSEQRLGNRRKAPVQRETDREEGAGTLGLDNDGAGGCNQRE